jgi:hypothetical protein
MTMKIKKNSQKKIYNSEICTWEDNIKMDFKNVRAAEPRKNLSGLRYSPMISSYEHGATFVFGK